MAYHDDLLDQAFDLIHRNPAAPKQADLRRGVSTAYYALFHLLIRETTVNWNRESSRDALGRMFDHRPMKKASKRVVDSATSPFVGEDPRFVQKLRTVAKAFVQLQDKRHLADYDNSKFWTWVEAFGEVATVMKAFEIWPSIASENIVQEYLVSLLIRARD